MKKLLSIILSAIMAVSMCTAFALPVLAADVKSPTAATLQNDKATVTVNGENKQGVVYSPSSTNPNEITFKYDGDGTLTGWENNLAALGLVEGTDFKLAQNADGSLTITFISQNAIAQWNAGKVCINALIDSEEETSEEVIDEEEEETTKKNASSKSPSTGASTAVLAGSIAAAGAGIAVLAASKKRDAE